MVDSFFVVDREGLKALQAGKPKIFLIRELISNSFDEPIQKLTVQMDYEAPYAYIKVIDDSPKGFKDLKDAYTLFKHTDKRSNPNQRGRYNLGEKQVISLCSEAKITTTTGAVIFNRKGRTISKKHMTVSGTIVDLKVRLSKAEFNELFGIKEYLTPKNVSFCVNNEEVHYKEPFKIFETRLTTELQEGESFKRTIRKTDVHVHKEDETKLYEMGIPVCEIECEYSIDVQQKVPLSTDRDSVSQAFLKDLYAEVLNNTYEDISENRISETWVRTGMSDERVSDDAVQNVVKKRFGAKSCIGTPGDNYGRDKALTGGYNVVHGREMSKDEWANVKRSGAIKASSEIFKPSFTNDGKYVIPDGTQRKVKEFAIKLAKELLGIDIQVEFWNFPHVDCRADYGGRLMRFYVNKLPKDFFDNPLSESVISIIIHEIAHEKGYHTDNSYILCLSDLGAATTKLALNKPSFFKPFK